MAVVTLKRLVLALLLTSTLAGCQSAGDGQDAMEGPVTLPSPVPAITEEAQIVLPLQAYEWTESQERVIREATVIRQNDCMRRFGRRPVFDAAGWQHVPEHQWSRTYGLIDLEQARQWGYEPPPAEFGDGEKDHSLPDPSVEDLEVMNGHKADGSPSQLTDVNGDPVPEYGCGAEGTRAIYPEYQADMDLLSTAVNSTNRWTEDPSVVEAAQLWSECMKQYGHSFTQRSEAGNSVADASSEAKVEMAIQDVTCAQQVNYPGIAHAVLSDLQRRYIDGRPADFEALQRHREEALSNAADALAGR